MISHSRLPLPAKEEKSRPHREIILINCNTAGEGRVSLLTLCGLVCVVNRGKSRDEKENGHERERSAFAKCAAWICSGVRRKVVVIDIPRAQQRQKRPLPSFVATLLRFSSPPPSASTTHNQWQLPPRRPPAGPHPDSDHHHHTLALARCTLAETRTFRSNSISNQQPIN